MDVTSLNVSERDQSSLAIEAVFGPEWPELAEDEVLNAQHVHWMMSVFGGRFLGFPGLACDNFVGENLGCDQFFLSHAHSDHMWGLHRLCELLVRKNCVRVNHRLYCSTVTKAFVVRKFAPMLDERFVKDLVNDTPVVVDVFDRTKGEMYKVRVTPIDANHCPGSLMFLLEKMSNVDCHEEDEEHDVDPEGDVAVSQRILYTGDFRLEALTSLSALSSLHCRGSLGGAMVKPLDAIYLDTTFCSKTYSSFPSRSVALASIWTLVNCWVRKNGVYRHQKARHVVLFHLSAQYGSEPILNHVYERSGANWLVHVSDKAFGDYLCKDELSDCVHTDPKVAQWIHACSFNNSRGKDELIQSEKDGALKVASGSSRYYGSGLPCQKGDFQVCQIRPSAMYFTQQRLQELQGNAVKCVGNNSYRVCYSSHSSLDELFEFVAHFKPKKVVPCAIPPNSSHAEVMELLEPFLAHNDATSRISRGLQLSDDDMVDLNGSNKRRGQAHCPSVSSGPVEKRLKSSNVTSTLQHMKRCKANRSMPSRTFEESVKGSSRRASLPHNMKIPAITITPSSPGHDPNHPDYPEFYEDPMYIESKKSSNSSTDSHLTESNKQVYMEVEEDTSKRSSSAEMMDESSFTTPPTATDTTYQGLNDDDDTPEFAAIISTASTSEEKRNCENFAKAKHIVIPFDLP